MAQLSSRRPFLRRIASGTSVLGAALLLAGCNTYSAGHNAASLARMAPPAAAVPAGCVLASAEAAAAGHDGDYVLAGAGESMVPLYRPGTAVVVHPTSYFMLRPGMVVVYRDPNGTPVAHLLLERTDRGWRAMGLNNPEPDVTLVTPENLVGIVRRAFTAAPPRVVAVADEPVAFAPTTLLH